MTNAIKNFRPALEKELAKANAKKGKHISRHGYQYANHGYQFDGQIQRTRAHAVEWRQRVLEQIEGPIACRTVRVDYINASVSYKIFGKIEDDGTATDVIAVLTRLGGGRTRFYSAEEIAENDALSVEGGRRAFGHSTIGTWATTKARTPSNK